MGSDQLFHRAMTEEDFGKGIVKLPTDTVVPEGNVIFLSYQHTIYGSGRIQWRDNLHSDVQNRHLR